MKRKSAIAFSIFLFLAFGFSRILIIDHSTPEEILSIKVWKDIYTNYTPDMETIKKINDLGKKVDVIVVFGSWCKDSKNNVPKLIKIFESLKNFKVSYYGVMRKGEQKLKYYRKYSIKRIPTVIILENGKELGRIIENPEETLEKDILKILKREKKCL